MEDFYKQFKENLENRPEPEVGEHSWKRLKKSLEEQERPAKTGFSGWWVAAALLFLLVGSNIFSLMEMRKVNDRLLTYVQQTDTIVQTKIVYQIDTVFQTNTVQKEVIRYVTSAFSPSLLMDKQQLYATVPNFNSNTNPIVFYPKKQATSTVATFDNSIYFTDYLQKKQLETSTLTDAETKKLTTAISFTDFDALANIELSPIPYDWATLADLDMVIPTVDINQRKTLAQHLYPMRPKGFSLGMFGGYVNAMVEDLSPQFSYAAGLEAAIYFSPALELWGNVAFQKIALESEELNATVGLPASPPPSDEFKFSHAKSIQPSLQYAMGMQYYFNANNKWKPFIGAGYGVVKLLPYEVQYEYELDDQEIKWNVEEDINTNTLIRDFLIVRGGLAYEISNHWNWKIQTSYRKNLSNNNGLLSPTLLNVEGGLTYSF